MPPCATEHSLSKRGLSLLPHFQDNLHSVKMVAQSGAMWPKVGGSRQAHHEKVALGRRNEALPANRAPVEDVAQQIACDRQRQAEAASDSALLTACRLSEALSQRCCSKTEKQIVTARTLYTYTPHTSFFSCTVRMHDDVYHTTWLKNVFVRITPYSWSSMMFSALNLIFHVVNAKENITCASANRGVLFCGRIHSSHRFSDASRRGQWFAGLTIEEVMSQLEVRRAELVGSAIFFGSACPVAIGRQPTGEWWLTRCKRSIGCRF